MKFTVKIYFLTIAIFLSIRIITCERKFLNSYLNLPLNNRCGLVHQPFIVNGSIAHADSFPWMVALIQQSENKRSFCGGVLITDQHVLTAAHCVYDKVPQQLKARLGAYDFSRDAEPSAVDYDVIRISNHINFERHSLRDDLSILTLHNKVASIFIPVCLPPLNRSFKNKRATVIGWGQISTAGSTSDILREVKVRVISNSNCSVYPSARITENVLCAGGNGFDSCQGDSGGPLMHKIREGRWGVIGIVSSGSECGRIGYPGIYSRINKYLVWIYNRIKTPIDSINNSMQTNEPDNLYIFGGLISNTLNIFNLKNRTWRNGRRLGMKIGGNAIATVDDKIYLIGGVSDDPSFPSWMSSVIQYDPSTNRYTNKKNMNSRRKGHGAVSIEDKIYVCGGDVPKRGQFKFFNFSSCEAYDTKIDRWYNVPSMNEERSGLAMVSRNGKIYAIGGRNSDNNNLGSVEVADVFNGFRWNTISSLRRGRSIAVAAVFGNFIYVTGGYVITDARRGRGRILDEVEKYDIINGGQWTFVTPMNSPRSAHGLIRWNNKLLVFGGSRIMGTSYTPNEYWCSTESYQEINQRWVQENVQLPECKMGFSAIAI